MRWLPCVVVVAGLCAVAATPTVVAGNEPSSEERLASFDAGPKTIDVSGYPPEMQQKYKLFSEKCSQCHSLARPINSDYALPDEWSRYVKRMMRKPGSGISQKQAKQVYEFLVYDSAIRKKDLLEQKKAAQGG